MSNITNTNTQAQPLVSSSSSKSLPSPSKSARSSLDDLAVEKDSLFDGLDVGVENVDVDVVASNSNSAASPSSSFSSPLSSASASVGIGGGGRFANRRTTADSADLRTLMAELTGSAQKQANSDSNSNSGRRSSSSSSSIGGSVSRRQTADPGDLAALHGQQSPSPLSHVVQFEAGTPVSIPPQNANANAIAIANGVDTSVDTSVNSSVNSSSVSERVPTPHSKGKGKGAASYGEEDESETETEDNEDTDDLPPLGSDSMKRKGGMSMGGGILSTANGVSNAKKQKRMSMPTGGGE